MAFLKNSRYHGLPTVEVKTRAGEAGEGVRHVKAVTLRPLSAPSGSPGSLKTVQENDRLDLLANTTYKDPTRFWHIADANSELEAERLLEPGAEIQVPKTK